MTDISITEAREELTSFPERLSRTHETIAITRRGKPVLAVMPWEEYEAIVETLEILGDSAAMTALKQGLEDVKRGRVLSWEEAKKRLSL